MSTAYHPQTNRLVECFNRILCEALAKYTNEEKNDWDLYISSVLFAYRNMQHNTTKFELFYLTYGRKVILLIDCDDITTKEEDKVNILLERTCKLIT